MKAVIQRVEKCSVSVQDKIVGNIKQGILVLLGVEKGDTKKDADYLADKIVNLRIFEDEDNKMNKSVLSIKGEILVVSQFTLLGDCRKGRRPSFIDAATPDIANDLYLYFIEKIKENNIHVENGVFQAMMKVSLINDGPVTLILTSKY